MRTAHLAGIRVTPIPGPSAVTAALSAAGLPTDRFCFEGFLPAKKKARADLLERLTNEPRTMVFYESVHRIEAALTDLVAAFGDDRPAFVGREITKLHEQCVHAPLGQLLQQTRAGTIPEKGEFVIVVGGSPEPQVSTAEIDRLLLGLANLAPAKDVAKAVARATGEKRNALYERLLKLREPKRRS